VKYRGEKVPWFVYVCFVLAFLGGWFTVLACLAVFVVLVIVNTVIWFARANQEGRR
jgi:hypothetical protein